MIDKKEVLDLLDRQREFLSSIQTDAEPPFYLENKWSALIEGVTIAMNIVRRMPDKDAKKEEEKP